SRPSQPPRATAEAAGDPPGTAVQRGDGVFGQAGQPGRHVEVRAAGPSGRGELGPDLRRILCLFELGEPAICSMDAICGYTFNAVLTVGSALLHNLLPIVLPLQTV